MIIVVQDWMMILISEVITMFDLILGAALVIAMAILNRPTKQDYIDTFNNYPFHDDDD